MHTGYTYLGGGAWHYDDNEVVKAKYRTSGQWRGFGRVQTFTGQGADPQTESEAIYYRGMSKDNDSTVVTLADSQGGTHEDVDQFAGDTLESTKYNYAGGVVTGSTINSCWVSPATASRTRTAPADTDRERHRAGGDLDPPGVGLRHLHHVAQYRNRHQLRH